MLELVICTVLVLFTTLIIMKLSDRYVSSLNSQLLVDGHISGALAICYR